MKPQTHVYLSFLVLVGSLATATPASAQDKRDSGTAEALFEEGRSLMAQGSYAAACAKFAASNAVAPSVGALLNEANCREQLGLTASAWALYREARNMACQLGDQKRIDVAQERSRMLEDRLSYVTVQVSEASRIEGLSIRLNGNVVTDAAWNQRVPIDPGTHEIRAEAPGRQVFNATIEVDAQKEHEVVEIPPLVAHEVKPLAKDPIGGKNASGTGNKHLNTVTAAGTRGVASSERSGWSWKRGVIIGIGAAGVASLTAGGVFGFKARSRWDQALGHCQPGRTQCGPQGATLGHEADSLAHRANILVAVGVITVSTGLVLWLVSRGKHRIEKPDRAAVMPLLTPESALIELSKEF